MTGVSDQKDRLFRLIALLRLIPREPNSISTSELRSKLAAQGFEVQPRTLQRDLSGKLSIEFPLLCQEEGNTNYWSFRADTPQSNFPSLDMPVALAFLMAESYLEKLLPHSTLQLLTPHFDQARKQLETQTQLSTARWAQRVRTLPNGKSLLPAKVDGEIWTTVSTALLKDQCLRVSYLSRGREEPRELHLHPAGLVARHSQSYLLARVEGYDDVRQFALHRIQQADELETPALVPNDFDIDHYVQGSLNNPAPSEMVELVADVSPQIAWLLSETPLSIEQSLEPLEGTDWQRLRAWVPDDKETLWWVFGLGENMRVWEPEGWSRTIRDRVVRMNENFES
ncbi:helix-turn-helix transcriptional regulator [Pseudomonas sp. FME51]|uniref:helix-turn-helix transcriptional regulator n=1 Tax=Pseudomonas sp. FME51 TaxID=2742609 RepID=UPI001868D3C4|nr:WYL domain-containing protein [Pseudomonas sp. FME51]